MTLQSIPPPPCICQHGAQHHVLTSSGTAECSFDHCKCDRYIRDNHRYPSGLIVST